MPPLSNEDSIHYIWMYVSKRQDNLKSSHDEWKSYSEVSIHILEEALAAGESKVKLDAGLVDLQQLIQYSHDDTDKKVAIKRLKRDDNEKRLRKNRFISNPSFVRNMNQYIGVYWVLFMTEVRKFLRLKDNDFPSQNQTIILEIVDKAISGIMEEGANMGKQCEAEWIGRQLTKTRGRGMADVWECCAKLYAKESFLYENVHQAMDFVGQPDHEMVWFSKIRTLGPFCLLLWDNPLRDKVIKINTKIYRGVDLSAAELDSYKNECFEQSKSTFILSSFTSCSRNNFIADRFGNTLLIFEIKQAATFDLAPFSNYPEEEEEVFYPGSQFIIENVVFNTAQKKYVVNISVQYKHVTDITTDQLKTAFIYTTMKQSFDTQFMPKKSLNSRLMSSIANKLTKSQVLTNPIQKKQNVYSNIEMQAAGFSYTGLEDTARCQACGLEVSEWTADMKPFTIHKQRSPACAYVRSMMPDKPIITPVTIMSTTDGDYNPAKRQKKDLTDEICESTVLTEITLLSEARRRSFSHWPSHMCPSSAQMVEAGFFCCNVGDRVICLYCNLICQQWTPQTDDPSEIHKKLSPKCPYVISKAKRRQGRTIFILNDANIREGMGDVTVNDPFRCNEMVYTAACHTAYIEIPRRQASFETWPNENLPPVDELRAKANDTTKQDRNANSTVGRGQLIIPDESALSRFVAARLDLPISQRLLIREFKLSLIKRCWEDQLKLKHDDYLDQIDLFICCIILQRQIDCIGGKKENIIVPSVTMKKFREQEQADAAAREQSAATNTETNVSNTTDIEMTTSSASSTTSDQNMEQSVDSAQNGKDKNRSVARKSDDSQTEIPTANLCVLCLEEERRLACIPCGHLATCVPCGHSLRSCPICRTNIDAFMRIYV
ncbi:unnamed protein product [Adineta ricciae]|uniref:NAD(+)--protein-arginine ADP-ribosyltransferase n=1 Tax=Adineta ricciae TaxID=249248 RepID=A0A814CW18_ADIRI|nr:unnamed protein product [Adineta ricciae]